MAGSRRRLSDLRRGFIAALVACGLAHCATSGGQGGFAGSESDGSADHDGSPAPAPTDGSGIDDTAPPHDATTGPDASTTNDGDATTADVTPDTTPADAPAEVFAAEGTPDAAMTRDANLESEASLADAGTGGDSSPGDGGADADCPASALYPQTTFVNLAPPIGMALDRNASDPIPNDAGAPPSGWHFYGASGAVCRDGSPTGFYVRYATSSKLMIYLEGGGACDSQHFCDHNPANINQIFPGGSNSQGQTIIGSVFLVSGLQQPYTTGIFDTTNAANPFNGWNQVYVPYCTGDVHFGTAPNALVPGITAPQQFVGYLNMQKFIGRIVPTFSDLTQVVLTGASSGGFGAGLNYGMVQDAFGSVPVTVMDDSGPPFSLTYLPACLQKEWRELWGFDAALPSDCAECNAPDGSGLTNLVYYWRQKYPGLKQGLISSMNDQVIELFFAQGMNACATNDPNLLVLGGLFADGGTVYPNSMFQAGLTDLRSTLACTGAFATYYISGTNHQHIFRDEFYQSLAGGETLAAWATDLVNGRMTQVGP